MGAGAVAAAMRFDKKAVQPEPLGIGAAGHRAEGAIGGLAVAGKLRMLGVEEKRQRLGRRGTLGFRRMLTRRDKVAGAHRYQSLRDRFVSALAPPSGQRAAPAGGASAGAG